ncbi:MAG: efflux RND transporter periplasmic adaptor subunit [Planctomycetaceae bacterium]|nr:efflux RND transporter periplasmic adaptor subunit [Planctomycetaceae bacterium]
MVQLRREDTDERLAAMAALAGTGASHAEFLQQLLAAVAAPDVVRGGGLWAAPDGLQIECRAVSGAAYQSWIANGGTGPAFSELRRESLSTGERRLIPCEHDDGSGDQNGGLIVHWPVGSPSGSSLIELLFDASSDESQRRGVLQFLQRAESHCAAFLYASGPTTAPTFAGGDWETLLLSLHGSLNLHESAFAIANDGRRLIGCDRVCVLVDDGPQLRLLSISGVDLPDRRSAAVRAIEAAAATVARTGDSVTYVESESGDSRALSDEIVAYADVCQVRTAMFATLKAADAEPGAQPVGVVIAEWFTRARPELFEARLARLSRHAAVGLQNAVRYSDIAWAQSLLPVHWVRRLWLGGRKAWTTAALIAISAISILLAIVPAPLVVTAAGELQPVVRQHVYAPSDGIVEQVLVEADDNVAANATLLTMNSPELDLEVQRIAGAIETWTKKLTSIGVRRLDDDRRADDPGAAERMSGEEAEVREELDSLRRQLALLETRRERLVVKAPIAGRVATWNVREDLMRRPVREGERLLTVADTHSGWILDLHLDERDAGHVVDAISDSPDGLDVEFLLATQADRTHHARLEQLAGAVQWDRDTRGERVSAPATAAVTTGGFDDERCGTSVLARIDCGHRSLGYVWFHDLYEAVVRLVWY